MKRSALFFLVALACAGVGAIAAPSACENLSVGDICSLNGFGVWCHPCDSRSWFVCGDAGIDVQRFCDAGFGFDPLEQRCVPELHGPACVANVHVRVPDAQAAAEEAADLWANDPYVAALEAQQPHATTTTTSSIDDVFGAMRAAASATLDEMMHAAAASIDGAAAATAAAAGAAMLTRSTSASAGGASARASTYTAGGLVLPGSEPRIVARHVSVSQPAGAASAVVTEQVTVSDGMPSGTTMTTTTTISRPGERAAAAAIAAAASADAEFEQAEMMQEAAFDLLAEGERAAHEAADALAAAGEAAAEGGTPGDGDAQLREAGALAADAQRLRGAAEELMAMADAQAAEATQALLEADAAADEAAGADADLPFLSEDAAAAVEAQLAALNAADARAVAELVNIALMGGDAIGGSAWLPAHPPSSSSSSLSEVFADPRDARLRAAFEDEVEQPSAEEEAEPLEPWDGRLRAAMGADVLGMRRAAAGKADVVVLPGLGRSSVATF